MTRFEGPPRPVDEFILYWMREEAFEYGYYRSMVECSADCAVLERLAGVVIPALRK